MRHRFGFAIAPCFVLLVVLLTGCQPASRGMDLGNAVFTKRHVSVLAEPNPDARPVVTVGPNARVLVLETRGGFTRIGIDDGRIEGWVESGALSSAPVRETTPAKRRTPAAPPRPTTKPAPSAPAAAPASPAPAPAEAVPPPAPVETPAAPKAQPAAAPTPSVFTPGEAQAAPPPAQKPVTPKKATGKQAQPDAFDPF